MSDDNPADPFAEMKAEFQKQLDDLRAEQQSVIDALKASNDELTKQNSDLQRALVKGVFAPSPQEAPKEKSEEEKYADEVQRISRLTLQRLGCEIKE